jgi:hypothetical protein
MSRSKIHDYSITDIHYHSDWLESNESARLDVWEEACRLNWFKPKT